MTKVKGTKTKWVKNPCNTEVACSVYQSFCQVLQLRQQQGHLRGIHVLQLE